MSHTHLNIFLFRLELAQRCHVFKSSPTTLFGERVGTLLCIQHLSTSFVCFFHRRNGPSRCCQDFAVRRQGELGGSQNNEPEAGDGYHLPRVTEAIRGLAAKASTLVQVAVHGVRPCHDRKGDLVIQNYLAQWGR